MFRKLRFRLMMVIAIAVVLWLLNRPKPEEITQADPSDIVIPPDNEDRIATDKPIPTPLTSRLSTDVDTGNIDDLRRISGIGPKISSTLNNAGIRTFTQLAEMKPEEIRQILRDAGVRLAQPDTWPEQARLAASGEINHPE